MSGIDAATALPIISSFGFGFLWSRRWRGLERGVAAVVLAFVAVSTSLALVGGAASLFHTSWLRPPAGPLLAAALVALGAGAGTPLARRPPAEPRASRGGPTRTEVVGLVVACASMLFAAVVSVIHPPGGYDALSFHLPLGLEFFRAGNVTGVLDPLRHALAVGDGAPRFALAYPGAAEVTEGAILRGFGEHVVTLFQVPFGVAIALGVGRFALELGSRAWWPVAFALAAPIVLFQSGQEGTDLVVGACLVAGFVFGVCGPVRRDRFLLASLALGASLAVKTIVLPIAGVIGLGMLGRLARASGERRRLLGWAAPMLGMALLPVAVWWGRDIAVFSNPFYPLRLRVAGVTLFPGVPRSIFGLGGQAWNYVPSSWAWPIYPLFEKYSGSSGFGAALAVGAAPALALAAWRRWRTGRAALLTWALLTAVSLAAAIVFPLPTPRRQLVPALLALAFVGLLPLLLPTARRALSIVLIASLFITVVVAVDRYRSMAGAPLARAAFYQQEWFTEERATALGAGTVVFDDVTWSDFGYPAVFGLEGPAHDKRVVTGSLGGDSPAAACRRLPPGAADVYVVSGSAVPLASIGRTYGPPRFRLLWTIVRPDAHGKHRRTLFTVSASCRAAAGG